MGEDGGRRNHVLQASPYTHDACQGRQVCLVKLEFAIVHDFIAGRRASTRVDRCCYDDDDDDGADLSTTPRLTTESRGRRAR